MIGLLTTSKKATVGSLVATTVAVLGPIAALFVSDTDITARTFVGVLLTGIIAGLTTFGSTWVTGNTEPYEPRHSAPPEP